PTTLLYLMPQRISIFNPQTRKTQPFKDAAETGLKSFLDLVTTRQGAVWIIGAKGFAQIRFDTPGRPEWIEYQLGPAGLETLESIVEGNDGELYLTGRASGEWRRLVKFDGRTGQTVYAGKQPF